MNSFILMFVEFIFVEFYFFGISLLLRIRMLFYYFLVILVDFCVLNEGFCCSVR